MEYNKTKRGLEKATGIVNVVFSSIMMITCVLLIILSITMISSTDPIYGYSYDPYWGYYYTDYTRVIGYVHPERSAGIALLIVSIILIVFYLIQLILSAKIIKSPVTEDGQIIERKGKRVTILVLSILSGNWIVAGLMIAVLCLKDMKEPKQQIYMSQTNVVPQQRMYNNVSSEFSLESKLNELKHLKELGVLDAVAFKNAVNKLITNYLKD